MDFAFALGDKVVIGEETAIVTGQTTYAYRADEFLLSFIDENGLPVERWFPQHQIQKVH